MPDAPADSPLRSDKENKLVELSKQYNKGLAVKDVVLGKLEPLLAENVVYHADEVLSAAVSKSVCRAMIRRYLVSVRERKWRCA